MKKLKLFFACLLMAVLSIGQVWADDPVTIASGTFDGKNATYTEGWSTTGTGKGRSDCIIVGSGENITSPSIDLSLYESITIAIKSRRYGSLSGNKATIAVSFAGESIGSVDATSTTATTSLTNIEYTVVAATSKTSTFVFTCSNATSAGSSHGAGINSITITGVAKSAAPTCENTVSVTKVTPVNGDFNISATEVCGDGDGGEITISNIEPAPGYTLDAVSATVGSYSALTGKVTGITGNTEITVTFKVLPKYTVSFNVGGSTASQADIAETTAGAGIELPAGPTPTCSGDGWTFAGWKETSAVDVETTTAPTLLLAGANYKPAANCTLYAVYKRTESGAVTDQDVTETFENQEAGSTYNSTMDYAASASNANIAWTIYYGCVSSNVKLTGDKSAQMRWYKSATSNLGYIQSTTPISGLQSVSFNAKTDNANSSTVKISVWYSTDGDTWTKVKDNEAAPTATGAISATIDGTVGTDYYVRIGVGDEGTAPSSSSAKLTIDDVHFSYKAGASTTYYLSSPTCCTKYNVNIAAGIENGSVSADPASACEGATVTLTFTPALNYHLSAWTLNGDNQDIAENTFEMPGADVTVSATFAQDACEPLGTPSVTVSGKAYPYDAVKLAWTAIEHADAYKVYIYDNEDNELEHNDAFAGVEYTIGQTLSASTTYKYSVQAFSNTPATYCPSTEAESTFTTDALPTAHLTLMNLGVEHAESADHAILTPFNLPSTAAACSKAFVGWDADENCATAPTYAKGAEFTFTSAEDVTLYAVYATETPGATTLTKLNESSMPADGDNIVIVAVVDENTSYALYQETQSNSYVKYWAFDDDVATVAADAKKYVTVANATAGKFYLGDATNGYVYSSSSNNLSVDLTNKSEWTIAWDADASAFTFSQGKYLSCRTDLSGDNTNLYRLAGGTPAGIYKLDVYKYGASASTFSNYSTECAAALADPTFSLNPVVVPVDDKYEEAINVVITNNASEGTIYYTTNGDNPTSASTEYTEAIVLDACGSTTIKAIVISATNQSGIASATYEIALPIPSVSAEDPYTEAEAVEVYNSGCYNNEDVWVTGTVQTAQFYSSNTYTITLTNGFQFYYFYESFDGENLVPFENDYIEAGDVLVAKGKLGKHNTTYQIANGYLVSRTPASSKESIANDAEHPYTVAQAIAFCNDPITYDLSESVYVQGVAAGAPNAQGTFNIYDEGEETTLFQLFKSDLGSFDAIKALDVVLAYGKIEKYNSTTYEMNQGEIVDVEAYVAPTVDVTGVTVDATATVQVGKTVQLTATVAPEDATNKNVTWSVKEGDEAYAEVSATGLVTGKAEGTATIVVTTEDGSFTDECVVTVNPISPWATVYTSNVAFVGGGNSHESNSKVVINEVEYAAQKVGSSDKTGTITVTVPAYTHTLHFHAVTWEKKTMTMSITSEDVTNISSPTLAIAADGGAKASGTYTLTGNPVDEYYAITFTPVATEAQIVFGYSSGADKRIIMYGINQEGGVLPVLDRIEITGTATALEYEIGDVFSPVGLGVNAIYTLAEVEQAPVALDVDENWEGWSFDPAYIGAATESVTVTATYEGKTDSKAVDVTVNVPATPEIVATPASINFGTVNQNATVAAEGISVTLKGVAAATVTLAGDGAAAFSIDKAALSELNSTINVTPVTSVAGTFAATITITDDANAAEAVEIALSMTVEAPGDNYVKVTATPTDWSGEYLLVYEDGTNAYVWNGDYNDGANNYASATISSNTIAKPAAAAVITIAAASEGKYTLRVNGDKYFQDNGSNAKLIFADAIEDAAEVTISYETDWTKLLFSERCIRFNNTSGQTRFRFYAANNQQAVQLYKKETPEPPTPVYETVRGGLTACNYYTICKPYSMTDVQGATLWSFAGKDDNFAYLVQEEAAEAGKPYIMFATATTVTAIIGSEDAAAGSNNGLYGTLSDMVQSNLDAAGTNIYLVIGNMLRRVDGQTGNSLPAGRAYVKLDDIQGGAPVQGNAPGKKYRKMPMQGQTTTGCELINAAEAPAKMMINGQLYILRGEKKYDATGRLVK